MLDVLRGPRRAPRAGHDVAGPGLALNRERQRAEQREQNRRGGEGNVHSAEDPKIGRDTDCAEGARAEGARAGGARPRRGLREGSESRVPEWGSVAGSPDRQRSGGRDTFPAPTRG